MYRPGGNPFPAKLAAVNGAVPSDAKSSYRRVAAHAASTSASLEARPLATAFASSTEARVVFGVAGPSSGVAPLTVSVKGMRRAHQGGGKGNTVSIVVR